MSKRNANEYRLSRKRRKEGASYARVDLDALTRRRDKVEDVRVWNVTMSETTGRVSASRKHRQHVYEGPPKALHEEFPTGASEEFAISADPELTPSPASVVKRKRVRITENDSVSSVPTFSAKLMSSHVGRQGWQVGSSTVRSCWTSCFARTVWAT